MTPYYEDGVVTIYHGDCREVRPTGHVFLGEVIVTDPPYGCDATTGWGGKWDGFEIEGDGDTGLRNWIIKSRLGPALVFGSPRIARPEGFKAVLIWSKGDHTGMGDLFFPWKPDFEEIYVFGDGFSGPRTSSVLEYNARTDSGRLHPTEKPLGLMRELIAKCPGGGFVVDPFAGSGTTLRAAKDLGRKAIGIEIEERYCEIAARRCAQEVMDLK